MAALEQRALAVVTMFVGDMAQSAGVPLGGVETSRTPPASLAGLTFPYCDPLKSEAALPLSLVKNTSVRPLI